jgi:hypothetical protein
VTLLLFPPQNFCMLTFMTAKDIRKQKLDHPLMLLLRPTYQISRKSVKWFKSTIMYAGTRTLTLKMYSVITCFFRTNLQSQCPANSPINCDPELCNSIALTNWLPEGMFHTTGTVTLCIIHFDLLLAHYFLLQNF